MRACWEALHASFVRSVSSLKAEQQFKAMGKSLPALASFEGTGALIAHLTTRSGDLDVKDQLYEVLIEAVQSRSDWAELATGLLWLGLWPGLDAIFRQRLRGFVELREDLVAEISFVFTTMIARIDLSGVQRVASTLVLNVEREVRECLTRRRTHEARLSDITDHEDDLGDETSRLDERELFADAQDLRAVRDWLRSIVGRDATLVIGAVLCGHDQGELADHLGIRPAAARKRFQRAIKRIRDHLGERP